MPEVKHEPKELSARGLFRSKMKQIELSWNSHGIGFASEIGEDFWRILEFEELRDLLGRAADGIALRRQLEATLFASANRQTRQSFEVSTESFQWVICLKPELQQNFMFFSKLAVGSSWKPAQEIPKQENFQILGHESAASGAVHWSFPKALESHGQTNQLATMV